MLGCGLRTEDSESARHLQTGRAQGLLLANWLSIRRGVAGRNRQGRRPDAQCPADLGNEWRVRVLWRDIRDRSSLRRSACATLLLEPSEEVAFEFHQSLDEGGT